MRTSRKASTKVMALLTASLLTVAGAAVVTPTSANAFIPDASLEGPSHGDDLGHGPKTARITLDTDKTKVKPGPSMPTSKLTVRHLIQSRENGNMASLISPQFCLN